MSYALFANMDFPNVQNKKQLQDNGTDCQSFFYLQSINKEHSYLLVEIKITSVQSITTNVFLQVRKRLSQYRTNGPMEKGSAPHPYQRTLLFRER